MVNTEYGITMSCTWGDDDKMSSDRLTNWIILYFLNKETKEPWSPGVVDPKHDLQAVCIMCKDIQGCNNLKRKLSAHQWFKEKIKLKTGKEVDWWKNRGLWKMNEALLSKYQCPKKETVDLTWSRAGKNKQKYYTWNKVPK